MKCQFDAGLKSQDTILMHLYKRVFPKWHYRPYGARPAVQAVRQLFVRVLGFFAVGLFGVRKNISFGLIRLVKFGFFSYIELSYGENF